MKATQPRVIGAVDTHKQINAVNVVDDHAVVLARKRLANTVEGYRQPSRLGRRWRQRSWAVEGCGGIRRHLPQRLVAQQEPLLDVPTRRSSLVRAFATTSDRKTDNIGVYSVAFAALNAPGQHQVTVGDERNTAAVGSPPAKAGRPAHPGGLLAASGAAHDAARWGPAAADRSQRQSLTC